MTHQYRLIRRAQGTNSLFHLDGKQIQCRTETVYGLGSMYVYETDDVREAQRLQIVHGFKIEARQVIQNVDREQIKALAEESPKIEAEEPKIEASKEEASKVIQTQKTGRRRGGKND